MLEEGQLVYHESRYDYDESPAILYIPSKLVMLKMMRACIGVDKKENLWMYDYPKLQM